MKTILILRISNHYIDFLVLLNQQELENVTCNYLPTIHSLHTEFN